MLNFIKPIELSICPKRLEFENHKSWYFLNLGETNTLNKNFIHKKHYVIYWHAMCINNLRVLAIG